MAFCNSLAFWRIFETLYCWPTQSILQLQMKKEFLTLAYLLLSLMRRSIRKFNIPPSGQPPGHLNFWRLDCSNSLPSGQKSRSNAPRISTELPLLKDKFRLQSNTLHAFQREICCNDTFKLLLKTLLNELFPNEGEILFCKIVKPCKNPKKLTGVLRQIKR